ncbi:MAG TPA: hypothetical protein VM884_09445 [Flavisolibacter sp.]|jgi:hypothetical protein|nr:hypothetical protein [Flavisolibacter sp.]
MKQTASLLGCLLLMSIFSQAQFLKGALKKVSEKIDGNPVHGILKKPAPITTSLSDAKWEVDSLDNFTPKEVKKSMLNLQRTPNGGFVLQPGSYEMHTQSYCLKAGTHGPGGGDGYLYALPLGPMEDVVMSIVRNSVSHTSIHQHDIQLLLWSVIARAKFDDLQNKIKVVATQLLTPQQIIKLNGGALGLIPDGLMQKGMDGLPAGVKAVIEAENKLRGMLTNTNSTFEEMERVAVLTGVAPEGEGSREVPSGRWSLHPDGYYVRYLPRGYSHTVTQLWIPKGSSAVGKEYDPATHIAVPGNTARQRLIQSGRAHQEN